MPRTLSNVAFVLKDLINKDCLVYLDYVIIYSISLTEH